MRITRFLLAALVFPDDGISFIHRDETLALGITPNIVMKWTGHSDYKAMKPYIDIVDSIKD